jgi:pimeloyl-ACP methyl ester carboxylesterase
MVSEVGSVLHEGEDGVITSGEFAARCQADPEFRLAARYWDGSLRFDIGETTLALRLRNGEASAEPVNGDDAGVLRLSGPAEVWDHLLAATPPRFFNDIVPAGAFGFEPSLGLVRGGDDLLFWQYYPAVARAIELLRPARAEEPVEPSDWRPDSFDSPVGRYVHLEIDGHDHRVYFEEAGTGIPLLLHHTAGASSVQWRHLFESSAITDHFRLVAYDLPFHGKSLPPTSRRWWREEYRLTLDFVMAVPVALRAALELDRPVFMGCSVGGQAALDLARYHPDEFRAVISLEPALKLDIDWPKLAGLWHPQVNNEMKARMMHGLTSPTSPEALRRETVFGYSATWPPAFLGDLHYYFDEHDLRTEAANIDTTRTSVDLLVGEYDWSAPIEFAQAAHAAIPGSTLTVMEGLGHFPMCENPEAFIAHLLPVLDRIRKETR